VPYKADSHLSASGNVVVQGGSFAFCNQPLAGSSAADLGRGEFRPQRGRCVSRDHASQYLKSPERTGT